MELSLLAYGLASFVFLLLLSKIAKSTSPNLDHIPAIGPSGFFTSYLGVWRYLTEGGHKMTEEGYKRYGDGLFKIPFMDRWVVFACGRKFVDDIRRATDDELNLLEASEVTAQITYTLGVETRIDPYHVAVINPTLTRNLVPCYGVIHDEIVQAFHDSFVAAKGNEWKAIPALHTMSEIVCRSTNRLFVGLPLCRDPDYLDLNVNFTIDAMKTAVSINLFPGFMRPVVGRLITPLPYYIKRASKHLSPIFEERMRKEAEYGKDWPDKPNDFVSWLLDIATGQQRTLRDLTLRILHSNFAAIHTSSMAFTHALYHLAANPEYVKPLREEVERIVAEEGWTKAGLDRMNKVDSFLKESQRFNGLGTITMGRIALKDYTFSDGTFLPKGTFVCVPLYATHHTEKTCSQPDVFDPWRSSTMREREGEAARHQMVTPALDYVPWGHGKHACPGRFMAVTELKTMLAHVVYTYDVKFKEEGVRPPNEWFASSCLPNRKAEVLFRKRRT